MSVLSIFFFTFTFRGHLKQYNLCSLTKIYRRVGDRIGISPTEVRGQGVGEEFTIVSIDKGVISLDGTVQFSHTATFVSPKSSTQSPALMSAEVVNLSRNIIITGDDFKHIPCDPSLPEAIPGEETSVEGCRCSSFRTQCTIGLHTAAMNAGEARIQNTRVERCGQRGEVISVLV